MPGWVRERSSLQAGQMQEHAAGRGLMQAQARIYTRVDSSVQAPKGSHCSCRRQILPST